MSDRFCRDCKFHRYDWPLGLFGGTEFSRCAHPSSLRPGARDDYLVGGKLPRAKQYYCSVVRGSGCADRCGPDGKFFEPRS